MNIRGFFIAFSSLLINLSQTASAQCSVSSPCGYTITARVSPVQIIPGSMSCEFGYNYNVRFSYSITISGVNTCYNDNIGFQPQILCNGQNNGYYTINVPAPATGSGPSVAGYSGTLTTSTNPYRSQNDCAVATPSLLGCAGLQMTIYGPGISSATFPCTLSVLPVVLRNFDASLQNQTVILKWSTASEKNNDYFSVERSLDGLVWEEVTRVKGAGTSFMASHYRAEDLNFKNTVNYYRLRQTDLDGRYTFFPTSFVDASERNLSVHAYPNPVSDLLTLEAPDDLYKEVKVINQLNQVLFSTKFVKSAQLDLSRLPSGAYILKISDGTNEIHSRILKN